MELPEHLNSSERQHALQEKLLADLEDYPVREKLRIGIERYFNLPEQERRLVDCHKFTSLLLYDTLMLPAEYDLEPLDRSDLNPGDHIVIADYRKYQSGADKREIKNLYHSMIYIGENHMLEKVGRDEDPKIEDLETGLQPYQGEGTPWKLIAR